MSGNGERTAVAAIRRKQGNKGRTPCLQDLNAGEHSQPEGAYEHAKLNARPEPAQNGSKEDKGGRLLRPLIMGVQARSCKLMKWWQPQQVRHSPF